MALPSTSNRKRGIRFLTVLAFCLPLLGCGDDGGECDECQSDSDCNAGLVCSTFDDDSRRCGSGTGATQCRVR